MGEIIKSLHKQAIRMWCYRAAQPERFASPKILNVCICCRSCIEDWKMPRSGSGDSCRSAMAYISIYHSCRDKLFCGSGLQ